MMARRRQFEKGRPEWLARIMHETSSRDRGDSRADRRGAGGRDGLRRKAHPEPLRSLDERSDLQAYHAAPPEVLASLSTINSAITPRRDAFAEQTSLPLLSHRGWKTVLAEFLLTQPAGRR